MKFLGVHINHPWTAFFVYFSIGAILSQYGIVNGTALIFCLFMGIAAYRIIVQPR